MDPMAFKLDSSVNDYGRSIKLLTSPSAPYPLFAELQTARAQKRWRVDGRINAP